MDRLPEIISKLTNQITEIEDTSRELFNLDLTGRQMYYLEVIDKLKNPNITELAAYLNLTKPTVKVAVDRLVERDYVVKTRSDDDRRTAHLHLSEKGKLINQMHDYAHRRIIEAFSRKLNTAEMKELEVLLGKIVDIRSIRKPNPPKN
jgi:DNA-binding MarR family transcriptional regulator